MNIWLKFMGYVIGSFLAVLVYMHFNPQNQQNQPQLMVLQQTMPTDPADPADPAVDTGLEPSEPQDTAYPQEYIASLPEITQVPQADDGELADGTIVIHGDGRGHFRGKVLINGVSMPYVIDTGASTTTVPLKLAKLANLPLGELNQVETANGVAVGQKSRIKEMKLGNAVLKDTEADINFTLEEVLIGMTTLKHFQMVLESNTLRLIPNKGYGDDEISLGATETKTWKKNVVCDSEGLDCKTVYGPAD